MNGIPSLQVHTKSHGPPSMLHTIYHILYTIYDIMADLDTEFPGDRRDSRDRERAPRPGSNLKRLGASEELLLMIEILHDLLYQNLKL